MEVDNNRPVPPVATGSSHGAPVENKQNKDESGHSPKPSSSAEQVSLTDTSRQLQELEKLIADQPVVDTKRVETIRQAIASDQFNVDADSIAEKLLRIEQALTDNR